MRENSGFQMQRKQKNILRFIGTWKLYHFCNHSEKISSKRHASSRQEMNWIRETSLKMSKKKFRENSNSSRKKKIQFYLVINGSNLIQPIIFNTYENYVNLKRTVLFKLIVDLQDYLNFYSKKHKTDAIIFYCWSN